MDNQQAKINWYPGHMAKTKRLLQEQLRRSSEQKLQNEMMLNELSNDSLVIDRIAREKYNMHREDEDLFLENVR